MKWNWCITRHNKERSGNRRYLFKSQRKHEIFFKKAGINRPLRQWMCEWESFECWMVSVQVTAYKWRSRNWWIRWSNTGAELKKRCIQERLMVCPVLQVIRRATLAPWPVSDLFEDPCRHQTQLYRPVRNEQIRCQTTKTEVSQLLSNIVRWSRPTGYRQKIEI